MRSLSKRFIGSVYIDGEEFSHPDVLLGVADSSRNNVVKQLRANILETLTSSYLNNHFVELRIFNPFNHEVEFVKY